MGGVGRLVAVVGIGVMVLGSCSSSEDTSPPTTEFDIQAILEDSGPYKCSLEMAAVVAEMLDTQRLELAQDQWGAQSPATRYALNLFILLQQVRFQEGIPVAVEQLARFATEACFDGDIANDVLRSEPGDEFYVANCDDGIIPVPGEEVCVDVAIGTGEQQPPVGQPDPGANTGTEQPPAGEMGEDSSSPPVESNPASGQSSIPGIGDGTTATWDNVVDAGQIELGSFVATLREDPELGDCPVIWPLDEIISLDGTGEGLPGFKTWGLNVDVQTPGGTDYGGASVWLDGAAPFDTSFEDGIDVERVTLSNGDLLELAWGQSNVARITVADSECVWTFATGSGFGLEVIVRSLATLS